MTSLQMRKCLSLDRLNFETKLEEMECQHSKNNEEYFDICSLEGDVAYAEEVNNSHLESVAFSRNTKEMTSSGFGKINSVKSGKKGKLNDVSRRKNDVKHLTTKQEHFGNPSSASSAVNFSNETRSEIDVEASTNEADSLFLKLKSIGKLSLTEKRNIFDLPNESGMPLSFSSPENPGNIAKMNDVCQKQYSANSRNFPSKNNEPKNGKCGGILNVPELHFDEVTEAQSLINKKQENKTRKNDELIRLSVPKEIHKSESERLKVKNRMAGKIKGKGGEDGMMPKIERQITQNDESIFNRWKTQGNSEMKVKTNLNANMLVKRSATSRKDALVTEDEEDHFSSSVDNVETRSVDTMTTQANSHNFPSFSGESYYSDSSFRANTAEPLDGHINTLEEFERQTLAERKDVKKQFRLKIAEAKTMLLEARLAAQEETTTKRFNEALKKHTELKLKRETKSTTPVLYSRGSSSVISSSSVSMSVLNGGVRNVQEIRKAEADFDRAKVKQIQTKIKLQKKKSLSKLSTDPQVKKLKSVKKKDRERLERYKVEKMISELRSLNMIEHADKISQAMARKDEYETKLRQELNQERKLAALLARKQKLEELARIRKEEKRKKIAEKEKNEQERRERETLEIAKRQAEAIKRREHNLKLQESMKYTLLATNMSRSFTYSYLPKLKKAPPAKVEKNDRERLKKVKARYLQGI